MWRLSVYQWFKTFHYRLNTIMIDHLVVTRTICRNEKVYRQHSINKAVAKGGYGGYSPPQLGKN